MRKKQVISLMLNAALLANSPLLGMEAEDDSAKQGVVQKFTGLSKLQNY